MTTRVQLTFPADTGISKDATSMTLHFETAATSAQAALIATNINRFFTVTNTTRAVKDYLSDRIDIGNTRLRFYDLDDPEPRVPYHDEVQSFGEPANSEGLPPELALVLSFQAVRTSGLNQARRRGRVYIGPLNHLAVGQTTATSDRPNTQFITDLKVAAARLKSESTSDEADWAVWSPTNGSASLVANGWVDNDFDVQRRRGLSATTRNTWT